MNHELKKQLILHEHPLLGHSVELGTPEMFEVPIVCRIVVDGPVRIRWSPISIECVSVLWVVYDERSVRFEDKGVCTVLLTVCHVT